MDFSPEQQERAKEQIRYAFATAEPKRPGMGGVAQMYQDIVIDLQCQLNAAVELLRRLEEAYALLDENAEECNGTNGGCVICQVQEFLSAFPAAEGGGSK